MKLGRLLLVFPILLALAPFSPTRAGADQDHPRHVKVTEYEEGRPMCPSRGLAIGNVTVRGGRCYVPVVLRDGRGAFLAFADPSVSIPPGQLVSLDSPEGERLRARILYLVPMPAQMSDQMLLIPMNTLQLVRLRQEDEEEQDGENNQYEGDQRQGDQQQEGDQHTHVVDSRLTVIMTGAPLPNMSVTFVVHI